MDCTKCGTRLKVERSINERNTIYRVYACSNCGRRYAAREQVYPINSDLGQQFSKELNSLMWERYGTLPQKCMKKED